MLRLLVVFIHVCGAMGLFGAAAIEGASLPTTGGTVWPSVFAAACFIAFGLLLTRRRRRIA